ncbi:MAG: hypothetical protein ACYC2H_00360 [Thermoplasmatota archaeon]
MRVRLLLIPAMLLAVVPLVAGHGSIEARELETELLNDEASDHFYTTGGYDIVRVFVGEAHDPALGLGGEGDGLYFRAFLSGDYGIALPGQAWRVTISFDAPDGPITRFIETTDGTTFQTDFDRLYAEPEAGEGVLVERAFIRLATAGLASGQTITGFRLESSVSGEMRDIAPGGVGLAGGVPVDVPTMTSTVVTESYTLRGPTAYIEATATQVDGAWRLDVKSLLKDGEQHVTVKPRQADGWTAKVSDPSSAIFAPGAEKSFTLETGSDGATGSLTVDVVSDVGGRIGLVFQPDGSQTVEGNLADTEGVQPPIEAPAKESPGLPAILFVVALALIASRRR